MKANKTGRPTQQETPNKRVREVSTSPQSPDNKKKSHTMTDAVNILRAIESLRNEVAGKFEELKGKLEVVETAVTNWNAEKEVLMARQDMLERRLDRLEREKKKKNIVVTGLSAINGDATNVKSAVNELLKTKLHSDVSVVDAFTIKQRSGVPKIIAKLATMEDKLKIMQEKKGLPSEILIRDDLIQKDHF